MEDKNRTRILIFLPGVVMFSIYLIWLIAMIPCMIFTVADFDEEFWIVLSAITFMCSLMIWGIIVTAQYADIDYSKIRLVSYKGIYNINISGIDSVEVRKTSTGKTSIIILTKEPILLIKRNNTPKNRFMQEFCFMYSEKIVGIFKHYIPNEVPWIYNDYYKNPNLEPKKPKKK